VWHDEISYTTAKISKTTSECIGSTDDVFVEEAGGPDLARNEGTTQNSNEETNGVESLGAFDSAC
jgi:hypothetical protein